MSMNNSLALSSYVLLQLRKHTSALLQENKLLKRKLAGAGVAGYADEVDKGSKKDE